MQPIIANQDISIQTKPLEERIKDFMEAKGVPIFDDEITLDGTIKRFSSRQNGKKSEWYVGHEIEPNKYIVIFASWRQSDQKHYFRSYEEGAVANEKLKLEMIEDRILEVQKEIEKEEQKRIREFFPKAQPAIKHPYLEKKKIKPHCSRIKDNTLVIPLYNIDGDLASLQYIFQESKGGFQKRFKRGISTKGLFCILGDFDNQKRYLVAEGFATGASIYENTNIPVVVAFSADNCLCVQAFLQHRYPKKRGELAADNDEKGLKIAKEWEKYFKTKVYIPTKEGLDFNDLYNELPKEEVNKIFSTKSIKPLNIAEIMKEEIQKEKWLNSILCEGTFNIIFGTGGVGKSRIAYELAFCLCSGEQFLYFEPYGQYKVLIVDGEMTAYEIKTRIQDLLDRHDTVEFPEENFKIIKTMDILKQTEEDIDLFQEEHRQRLNEAIQEADVVFLDNFGSLTIPPEGDSFKLDKSQWIKMFGWIKEWRSKGKTFVLVMHANKDGKLEGVGKIRNDADLVLEIKKPIDIDKESSLHVEVYYDKARKIPIYNQEPFRTKLKPEIIKFFGWDSIKLKT